jgi:hypothetical protein
LPVGRDKAGSVVIDQDARGQIRKGLRGAGLKRNTGENRAREKVTA